ncbi:hypothetical protein ACMSEZ_05795 [Bacteroides thetaiotaomicron]
MPTGILSPLALTNVKFSTGGVESCAATGAGAARRLAGKASVTLDCSL